MTAMKIYWVGSLMFLLLTLGLFFETATGPGRDYSRDPFVCLSAFETFQPFFPWMLSWAGLGVALGLLQVYVALPYVLKVISALAFVLGVLGYVFGYYWNIRQMQVEEVANPLSWAVFLIGLLLLFSLAVNVYGVARFSSGLREENR